MWYNCNYRIMKEKMSKKRKSGRPPVIGVKRGRLLQFRLTDNEFIALKAFAEKSGSGTVSDYVRGKILPSSGGADVYGVSNNDG